MYISSPKPQLHKRPVQYLQKQKQNQSSELFNKNTPTSKLVEQRDKFLKQKTEADKKLADLDKELIVNQAKMKKNHKLGIASIATMAPSILMPMFIGPWGALPAALSVTAVVGTMLHKYKLEDRQHKIGSEKYDAQTKQVIADKHLEKYNEEIDARTKAEEAAAKKQQALKQRTIDAANKLKKGTDSSDDTFKDEETFIEIEGIRLDKNMGLAHQ